MSTANGQGFAGRWASMTYDAKLAVANGDHDRLARIEAVALTAADPADRLHRTKVRLGDLRRDIDGTRSLLDGLLDARDEQIVIAVLLGEQQSRVAELAGVGPQSVSFVIGTSTRQR